MHQRLRRLELSQRRGDDDFRLFFVSGGFEGDDASAFLRANGYDIRPSDMVVRFVPAKDGKPVERPMEISPMSTPEQKCIGGPER